MGITMKNAKVWVEKVVIPTYEIGEAEKILYSWIKEFIREARERFILIPPLKRSATRRWTRNTRRFFWKMNI